MYGCSYGVMFCIVCSSNDLEYLYTLIKWTYLMKSEVMMNNKCFFLQVTWKDEYICPFKERLMLKSDWHEMLKSFKETC